MSNLDENSLYEKIIKLEEQNNNLKNSIKQLEKNIAELLRKAQPNIEDYLISDKLSICFAKGKDEDFEIIEIIGNTLHLKGKAYIIPSNKENETLLHIMYLNKAQ